VPKPQDRLIRPLPLLAVAIVATLATPGVANAHLRSDVVAVDYRATVMTQKGPFAARVYETDQALRLAVTHEPSAGLLKKSRLVTSRIVAGYRISDGGAVPWHDSRLRGLPTGVRRAVWTIPLLVDGRRGRLRGELMRFPQPALWP
jgi:hypothetical protein